MNPLLLARLLQMLSSSGQGYAGGSALQGGVNRLPEQYQPNVPTELKPASQAGLNAAIGASAFIPVAGPFVSAGLSLFANHRKKQLMDKMKSEAEDKAMAYNNANPVMPQRPQMQPLGMFGQQQRQRMAPAGFAPGSLPGQNPFMNPPPGQQAAPMASTGLRTAASTSGGGTNDISDNRGILPSMPSGGGQYPGDLSGFGRYLNRAGTHHPYGGLIRQLLAQRLFYGLDPRILAGRTNAATQSAQDARMGFANTMGRSGDTSGYNYGIGTGLDMATSNQLANIYPQWLEDKQRYVDEIIGMIRGTRKGRTPPNMAPNGGPDIASILGGLGGAASGAANLYNAFGRSGGSALNTAGVAQGLAGGYGI